MSVYPYIYTFIIFICIKRFLTSFYIYILISLICLCTCYLSVCPFSNVSVFHDYVSIFLSIIYSASVICLSTIFSSICHLPVNANTSIHLFSILLSTCLGAIDLYHFCKDYLENFTPLVLVIMGLRVGRRTKDQDHASLCWSLSYFTGASFSSPDSANKTAKV